ncbi:anti-H(O) lectin 2-like [Vitis riparia]|uniref:anti-H(O) lectin 2-like n=1 Tax=Vitis riparia TaxID=96939 RepID=UPI00155B2C58|nr:anti-H(O) lectin 2-like [Vitis riparia]
MFMLLVVCGFLNQAALSLAEPISFSFSSFDPGNCGTSSELICMGSVTAGEGYLNITPQPPHENETSPTSSTNMVGRVLYRHPVQAWPALITTTFTVRISPFPNSTGSGDGMAFIMAQDSQPSPAGSFGSFLGILDRSTEGIVNTPVRYCKFV